MPAFEYRVLDASGRELKGVEEGDTARQVRQQLRERGLVPLSVEEVRQRLRASRGGGLPSLQRGISTTELALLTRQMATLVRSGLPVEEALGTVAKQSEGHRSKGMLLAVRSRVMEGRSLADGLAEYPAVFPELYRATVAAGEQSGHLDIVLERLADYTERRQQLRQKLQLALLYPTLLTIVALLVTVGLLTYVVPQVVQVFENIDQQLPWLTRALIATSDFLRDYGLVLFATMVLFLVVFNRLLRNVALRQRWQRLLQRIPLIGRLIRGLNTARFTRTFSILAASGVPVLDAMRISSQVMTSLPMRNSVEQAAEQVREGGAIARALEQDGIFPPMVLQLIASGESSGNLETMLERAAENQERELETLIAALMGLFEPLLILLMGGMVLIIVLAILLPVFELNQLVQ